MKKSILSTLLIISMLFFSVTLNINAAEDEQGGETSSLTDGTEAEDIWQNGIKGTYLQAGNCKIVNKGNRVVRVSGGTDAYQACDSIRATIYLDQYINGEWVEVDYKFVSATEAYTVNGGENFTVTGGYYYRARGYHYVREGSTIETTTTESEGIYIN